MYYIEKSIIFLARNPIYLVIYLIFSVITSQVSMFRHLGLVGILPSFIIEISIPLVSFYLLTGLYSCIWKRFSGKQTKFGNILKEANQYFPRVLAVSTVYAIVILVFMGLCMYLHYKIFYSDISMVLYSRQLDANIVRSASFYLIFIPFAYALPSIFVSDWNGTMYALRTSPKLIIKESSNSIPVICLLTLIFLIDIFANYRTNYDLTSKTYWVVTATEGMIKYLIGLLTFLTAAQIYTIIKGEFKPKG